MPQGKIVRWNRSRGFGFIEPLDGGDDIFCHTSDVRGGDDAKLDDGDEVDYDEKWDDRKGKYRATNVEGPEGGGRGRSRSPRRSRSRGRGGRSPPRYGGRDRSRSRGRGGGSFQEFRAGDWDCPKCGFHNFARNERCKDCGEDRPRGGGGGGGRGRERSYSRDRYDSRDRDDRRGGGGGRDRY